MAKILVADDEQKIREVIREYSEFNGHEITEAADGMTAVGLCKLNDYDLIIMDIMMPKLDGFFRLQGDQEDKGYTYYNAFGQKRGIRQALRL